MIDRNKRDQEAWLREKTIDSLKSNSYLEVGDIIQVASDNNFYEVVNETTDIVLSNNLYAKVIPSEIIGNVSTTNKLKVPVNISLSGDVSGTSPFDGSENINMNVKLNADNIAGIDAAKVTSGVLDIARIPQGALERCVVVADDTARFKLTTSQVQVGDTVKVTATNKMYFVIDNTKLTTEEGYTVYTAGTATEVPWSGVTGKPSKYPSEAHTHTKSEITDFPTALKNPTGLTISLNGTSQGAYDGSAAKSINITAANVGALGVSSNAVSATKLANARTINGVAFDGTANITITATANGGTSSACSGNSATATKLQTARTINGVSFDGTSNITITAAANGGTSSACTGNSATATKLITARKIGNATFDGTSDITLSQIGAQVAGSYALESHTHNYLALSGGTMTGNLIGQSAGTISGFGKVYNAVWNDYAEFFERGEETEPGDIIALDTKSVEEKYVKASKENNLIVGVHSNSFAHLIGGEEPPENEDFYEYNIKKFIPIGLAGRVKCKVKGTIKKGDYIVISDIAGVGISLKDNLTLCGTIVGVSLENKTTEDIGLIKILIN